MKAIENAINRFRGEPIPGAFRCKLCHREVMETRRAIHEMICPVWLSWVR